MTANPIDLVGGLTSAANVPKGDFVAWAKARVPTVMASVSEVRSTTLVGQIVFKLKTTGASYYLDTTDTTTADDGLTCIISSDGYRFKIQTGLLTPSLTALGGVFAKNALAHRFVTGLDTSGNLLVAQPALADLSDGLSMDTDGTLAANSDTHIPSQKAVKTYVASTLSGVTLTNMIRPEDFGAKGDGVVKTSGGAITSGTNSFTSSGYSYIAGDAGKTIAIDGAGAAGACLVTTISSASGGAAILAVNASTTVTTAAHEWGTDDSVALHNMGAACGGKAIWFGAGKVYFHKDTAGNPNIIRFADSSFKIYGNGATIKALANAGAASYGLWFGDASFVGNGPTDFSVADLIYDGNMVRRISSGTIPNATGQDAGYFFIGCLRFQLLNLRARNTTSDGLYIGGDTRTGRASSFWVVVGGVFENAGRNGISIVGASYGTFWGVLSQNHSFGVAHTNISYGWDFEPDGSWNQNANIYCNSCIASSCDTGFGSNITNGANSGLVWGQCRAEACRAGFYESGSGSTKVFAASLVGNTTNFTNLTEKISGF